MIRRCKLENAQVTRHVFFFSLNLLIIHHVPHHQFLEFPLQLQLQIQLDRLLLIQNHLVLLHPHRNPRPKTNVKMKFLLIINTELLCAICIANRITFSSGEMPNVCFIMTSTACANSYEF